MLGSIIAPIDGKKHKAVALIGCLTIYTKLKADRRAQRPPYITVNTQCVGHVVGVNAYGSDKGSEVELATDTISAEAWVADLQNETRLASQPTKDYRLEPSW